MEFNNLSSILYIAASTGASIGITIFVGCLLLRLNRKEKENNSIFSINPKIGLFELPIFWMGITLPLSLFISSGIPLWSNYHFMLTADAYIKFMEISKLPAILLATAIPISAAISRAHSTHQTAKQIKELTKKNNFDIYFRMKDHTIEKINKDIKFKNNISEELNLGESLFDSILKGSPEDGIPEIDLIKTNKILRKLELIKEKTHEFNNEEELKEAAFLYHEISNLLLIMFFDLKIDSKKIIDDDDKIYINIFKKIDQESRYNPKLHSEIIIGKDTIKLVRIYSVLSNSITSTMRNGNNLNKEEIEITIKKVESGLQEFIVFLLFKLEKTNEKINKIVNEYSSKGTIHINIDDGKFK